MFEAKIINEINANYLLIMSDETKYPGYEIKMFEYNRIKGFLPFEISRINNNIAYQYKIMEYENMEKAFYCKSFDIENIRNLFLSIMAVRQKAGEYLLNSDSIILNPEYIFINGEEFLFCYYPGQKQAFCKGIRELMEYILEHLDHGNQETVMMAYGLYQKILKNNFTMESLMEVFQKPNDNIIQQVSVRKVNSKNESLDEILTEQKNVIKKEENLADIMELEAELEEKSISFNKKTDKKHNNRIRNKSIKKSKKLFPLFFKTKNEVLSGTKNTILLAESSPYGSTQMLNCKILKNQGTGNDILLSNFPVHIGNCTGDAECAIDNIMVSRNHAVITWECGIYYVEDKDSTNGTYINGSRISPYEPVQIKEGDVISFANEKYRLN